MNLGEDFYLNLMARLNDEWGIGLMLLVAYPVAIGMTIAVVADFYGASTNPFPLLIGPILFLAMLSLMHVRANEIRKKVDATVSSSDNTPDKVVETLK